MRLWHQKLIHYLPDHQLLGQHRELSALRGKGWGRKHSTVDYVFRHPFSHLFWFHYLVMKEMEERGFRVDICWYVHSYRGKVMMFSYAGSELVENDFMTNSTVIQNRETGVTAEMIYPEHDDRYLKECLLNLMNKSVVMKNGFSLEKELITLDLKGV